jgi:hypothetical protein
MEFLIYLAGVILFSAFYFQLKAALGGGVWFFFAVAAYLLCVRVVGRFVNRRLGRSRRGGGSR